MEQFLNNAIILETDNRDCRCTQCLKQDHKYFVYKNLAMCFDCVNHYWSKFGKSGLFYSKGYGININCTVCDKIINPMDIPFSNQNCHYCVECFNTMPQLKYGTFVNNTNHEPINLRYYKIDITN